MNRIFFALILLAFSSAAYRELTGWVDPAGKHAMDLVTSGALDAAKGSATMALGLIGGMALFLGVVKVAEEGGLMLIIAKLVRPLMVWLFPEVPANHPAMSMMILNLSANALGLGNAATPFGIKAMVELDKLNRTKGTSTNAMALFLAMNTSSVALLPTGVIVWRQQLGSHDPSGILVTTLFATLLSTTTAIAASKLLQRFAPMPPPNDDAPDVSAYEAAHDQPGYPLWVSLLALAGLFSIIPLSVIYNEQMSTVVAPWIVPSLIFGFVAFGWARGVAVYDVFIQGAKQGFDIAVMIIPYLVAVLSALGMLRASGALDAITSRLSFLGAVGMPPEALPMALIRPLSGSGATGTMVDIMTAHGPDSHTGYLVSTIQGSTETTFYVIALYFGAVGVRNVRHTVPAALLADFMGIAGAVIACSVLYGHLPISLPPIAH